MPGKSNMDVEASMVSHRWPWPCLPRSQAMRARDDIWRFPRYLGGQDGRRQRGQAVRVDASLGPGVEQVDSAVPDSGISNWCQNMHIDGLCEQHCCVGSCR